MFIYSILLAVLVVYAFFENYSNRNRQAFISFLLIFVVFSFRSYEVGSDTSRYIDEYLAQTSELRGIDLGFSEYNELLYNLGLSARQYLIVTSFFICFPVYFFIRKVSDRKSLTYILYITIGNFVINLSGIRQSLAVSILLLGYLFSLYVSAKWKKYLIIVVFIVLAALFHTTAIFCLIYIPMLWASQKNFKLNIKLLALFTLTPIILPFTGFIGSIVENMMIFRYEHYEADSSQINVVAYFVIPYVIFVYLTYLKFLEREVTSCSNDNFAYFCAFMYVICASASFYIPILNRMQYYFSLPMISLIPTLTSRLSIPYRRLLQTAIVTICILFFFIGQTDGTMKIDNYMFSLD